MTDEQIKQMAQQFLSWKLPGDFHPDGGISFERADREPGSAWWPTGTNLLTYNQALAMVQHMVAALRLEALEAARGEGAGWRDIATAPKNGEWILLRGRNAAGFPMIPVVCSWARHPEGYMCWLDAASHRDLTVLVADVPPGTSADWHPLPGTDATPPETADERQAAIVAALRGRFTQLRQHPEDQAFARMVADWIESGEWRRA